MEHFAERVLGRVHAVHNSFVQSGLLRNCSVRRRSGQGREARGAGDRQCRLRVGPLRNPVNDATAVAEAFGKLGFHKAILKKSLGEDAFRTALRELAREARGADLGAVYFAGHGTEVGGRNFLIPVDATPATAGDLNLEAIALDTVLDQLASVTRLKLIILDVCRNNPFPVTGGMRNVTRGLSRIEPEDNTLMIYAAKGTL